jgi:hypothetical protein
MSNEQKAVIKAAAQYKPPAWIKYVGWLARTTRWIGALAGGTLAWMAETEWGVMIFAGAYGLGKVAELLGDYLDDKKFNESFQQALEG